MARKQMRVFEGNYYKLNFIAGTKAAAKRTIKNMNKTLIFRMRKYRIIPVKATEYEQKKYGRKTVYAVYSYG